ncbi:MAG TPA: malto-oligosyltrehalose trehalohydrolase [Terriglobia bacterium]|nr:malto-oligosyltrehalose trehalohydrolase [Terriglobia bacterium]
MNSPTVKRRHPIGAEPRAGGGVDFRVWAPAAKNVQVCLEGGPGSPATIAMTAGDDGYFSCFIDSAGPSSSYRFQLDDQPNLLPDPASRFQPNGPHGASEVIDPYSFQWTDSGWPGITPLGQILYEMHIGTFTKEGTWKASSEQLKELASAGITVIEVMPIADFPGRFGWGYDGVNLFAPTWLYGRPDDLQSFIDEAHATGLGVILDVVYNHFGPDGNYITNFSPYYFNSKSTTDWGQAINFDGEQSSHVRAFFLANAAHWIEEFHFDGLRLDATQDIHDESSPHILREIGEIARSAAGTRKIIVIAENETQHTRLVRPPTEQGYGLDALWNDDFHHAAMVALTGRSEAYYTDYKGTPQEFISAVKYGYLFQGEWYAWQKQRRGTPALDLEPANFVTFIQNHDQVANTARGERPNLLATAGKYKAVTALLLLGPATPMLFQGQEFAATTPFLYFCDHKAELSKQVREGRAQFLSQFRSLALPEMQDVFGDPGNPSTFEASKLDFSERQKNVALYSLHKDLIALRRQDPVFCAPRKGALDGAVLSSEAFVLRYFGGEHGDRLLLINLGQDEHLDPAPEPLLAPPADSTWNVVWSSEDPKYGGYGTYPPDSSDNWRLPGNSAIVLRSELNRRD